MTGTGRSPLDLAGADPDEEALPFALVTSVREMCSRTAALAREQGRGLVAAGLEAGDDGPPRPARVVVTGVCGAGASSLVGALVGRPDLLPVDDLGAGHAPVSVGRGPTDRARALFPASPDPASDAPAVPVVSAAGAGRAVPVPLEQVAACVAADLAERPALVQVQLSAPGLQGLELVDGGPLPGGPVGVAAAAGLAEAAEAVVLVHDVKSPPGADEVAVLQAVASRTALVVLALSRTDATADHEPVVESARHLLARTPGLDQVVLLTTSSTLAATAARLREASSPRADLLGRLSGVDELAGLVRERVAGRRGAARLVARAKTCAQVAEQLVAALPPAGDPDAAALGAETDRLAALLSGDANARADLQHALQRLRSVPRAELEDGVRRVRGGLREEIETAGTLVVDEVAARLHTGLADEVARVWLLQGDLALAAADLVERAFDGADEVGRLRSALARADASAAAPGALRALSGPSAAAMAQLDAQNRMAVARSAMMMLPALTNPARLALGLAMGGGAIGALLFGQSKARDAQVRSHLRTWVDQACTDAQRGLLTAVDVRSQVAQQHLEQRVLDLSSALRLRREAVAERAARVGPAPTDPRRDPALRLLGDARRLVATVTDPTSWTPVPSRPRERS